MKWQFWMFASFAVAFAVEVVVLDTKWFPLVLFVAYTALAIREYRLTKRSERDQ